jgi:hypothetical protein
MCISWLLGPNGRFYLSLTPKIAPIEDSAVGRPPGLGAALDYLDSMAMSRKIRATANANYFGYLGTLRSCFKNYCAWHSGVARRLAMLMYSHVHCALLVPSLGLAPSGPACGCSKSFLTILSRRRAPCSAGARDIFKIASESATLPQREAVTTCCNHNDLHGYCC